MGIVLLIISGLVLLVANIWLIIIAFQRTVLWGLAVLLVPFAALVFVIMYWHEAKKPFLISLAASIVMWISVFMAFPDINTDNLTQVVEDLESGEIKPNQAFEQYGKLDQAGEAGLPGEGVIEGEAMGLEGGESTISADSPTSVAEGEAVALVDATSEAKAAVLPKP